MVQVIVIIFIMVVGLYQGARRDLVDQGLYVGNRGHAQKTQPVTTEAKEEQQPVTPGAIDTLRKSIKNRRQNLKKSKKVDDDLGIMDRAIQVLRSGTDATAKEVINLITDKALQVWKLKQEIQEKNSAMQDESLQTIEQDKTKLLEELKEAIKAWELEMEKKVADLKQEAMKRFPDADTTLLEEKLKEIAPTSGDLNKDTISDIENVIQMWKEVELKVEQLKRSFPDADTTELAMKLKEIAPTGDLSQKKVRPIRKAIYEWLETRVHKLKKEFPDADMTEIEKELKEIVHTSGDLNKNKNPKIEWVIQVWDCVTKIEEVIRLWQQNQSIEKRNRVEKLKQEAKRQLPEADMTELEKQSIEKRKKRVEELKQKAKQQLPEADMTELEKKLQEISPTSADLDKDKIIEIEEAIRAWNLKQDTERREKKQKATGHDPAVDMTEREEEKPSGVHVDSTRVNEPVKTQGLNKDSTNKMRMEVLLPIAILWLLIQ